MRLATPICAALFASFIAFACGDASPPPDADASDVTPPTAEEYEADRDALAARHGGHCENRDPLRQVFWGDLHVHTGASMDAYMFGTRGRPSDAYAFARGETLRMTPLDEQGQPTRPIQIDRPLDFAAITDHAANFGGVKLCQEPGSAVYDSEFCIDYRQPLDVSGGVAGGDLAAIVEEIQRRSGEALVSMQVCGETGERCRDAAIDVWNETQSAAAAHLDESPACGFTTFIAYEYTLTPNLTKIHRNVIFRNTIVPELPVSSADEPEPIGLWRALREQCTDAGTGCDVLAIPHNSNLSNGHMFALEYGEAQTVAEQAEVARLRAAMEPIVEMSQMKGDSECRNDMWGVLGDTDEFCSWEKIREPETPDCEDGTGEGALGNQGCVSRRDFVRYALVEGLREADRIGVNPFPFGFIAATDGHDGAPGPVEEARLDLSMGRPGPGIGRNLGGLAGVWAEENSRESLFEAMRRRETYGTSGPRIPVRFFGGFDYPDDLCSQADWVRQGYEGGVPMGGDLAADPNGRAPRFVVSALKDPGTDRFRGTDLQRIQIIKGWAGEDGQIHQRVIDVAGGPNDTTVNPSDCATIGSGAETLCAVWTDPDFDPDQRAVYYARVLENPSCRQTGWACVDGPRRPAWCDAPGVELETQERAWTSPIWYTPSADERG